jgi:hypothetical protein
MNLEPPIIDSLVFDYHFCIGLLEFAPESFSQIDALRGMASAYGANELQIYALDDGSTLAAIDVNYNAPTNIAAALCFLADVAPVIHGANGEVECAVIEEPGELSWHYFMVRDNRLWRQAACFRRAPREIVTEIVPADWKGIQAVAYQGKLRFPDLPAEKAAEVDQYIRNTWRTKSRHNDQFDLAYYGGKDTQRWYIQYLMGLAEVLGPDVTVLGEITCNMERFDGETYRDEHEIYGVDRGYVYRYRGIVDRDCDWIEVNLQEVQRPSSEYHEVSRARA